MHYAFITLALVWFVVLAPIRVIAITAIGCFLIASAVRIFTSVVANLKVSYTASIKAVLLSASLSLVTLLLIAGSLTGFSISNVLALNPLVILAALLGSYIWGYQLCLGTTFGASSLIAVLSAIASVAILFGIRTLI